MNKDNTLFTKSMRKTHTIYMPDMLHYHNEFLSAAFSLGGYRLDVVLESATETFLCLFSSR
ncbi:MAG: hypothetical protein K6C96_12030 [Butyrivibrio sp.]|nr:hypothetical protein [Butyrivibrio sp.]